MRANLPAVDARVHPVTFWSFYWMNDKGTDAPKSKEPEEGGITLGTSAYHAVLAVKDERGKRSPPAAVFNP
jgi:hypothetical protein